MMFWQSADVTRPDDLLNANRRFIFNLRPDELAESKIVFKKEPAYSIRSRTISSIPDVFEVIVEKDKVYYSVFRSTTEVEAKKCLEIYSTNTNGLIKYIKGSDIISVGKNLEELLEQSVQHSDYSIAHFAAVFSMTDAFTQHQQQVIQTINSQNGTFRYTPLMVLIKSDKMNFDTLAAILKAGVHLDAIDSVGNTCLHYAAASNDDQVFELVFAYCKKEFQTECLRWRNNKGMTPQYVACIAEKFTHIKVIFKHPLPMDCLIMDPPLSENKNWIHSYVDKSKLRSIKPEWGKTMVNMEEIMGEIDWAEVRLGGCPLHWIRTKPSMHKFLEMKFPEDIVNFNHETPVHVYSRKKNDGCLLLLLSFGYTPNPPQPKPGPIKRDIVFKSPLEYAIESKQLTITMALLVFDADVNALTSDGKSMRHLCRKKKKGDVTLRALHLIGAPRCGPDVEGCFDGCAHNGKNEGLDDGRWAPLEEKYFFNEFAMRDLVEELEKSKFNGEKVVNLISFDGGGVKGLVSCQVLVEMEKHLKHPVHEYFEWKAGTSTGSFLSAGLSLKIRATDLRTFYIKMKDTVITHVKPYSGTSLDNALKDLLGAETKIKNVHGKLLVTATRADRHPPQLQIFRSYPPPCELNINYRGVACESIPEERFLWFCCRASGAAPMYFPPQGPYVDGGFISANPTIDALTEFFYFQRKRILDLGKDKQEKLGVILSIGTGRWPITQSEVVDFGIKFQYNFNTIKQSLSLINMMSVTSLATDTYVVDRAQMWCRSINALFFRVTPPMSQQWALDVVDDADVITVMFETKTYLMSLKPELVRLCRLLEISLENNNQNTSRFASLF